MKQEVVILSDDAEYDWVRFFARQVEQELLRREIDVLSVDLKCADAIDKLNCINNVTEEPIFVLTFEGNGFLIPSIITGMNWIDLLKNRVYAYFSQHPCYYGKQLAAAKSWNISLLCTERNAVEYVNRYYIQYEGVSAIVPPAFLGENAEKPWEEREIEILVPASYRKEEHLPEVPETLGISPGDEELMQWNQNYSRYYDCLQNIYIEKMVRSLLRAGCDVTVYGSGWDTFAVTEEEHGRLHPIGNEMGFRFEELLDIMGNSKMVVQNHVKHPEGLTLDLLCAMANGAAVLTDRHPILEECFGDGAVLFYENGELDGVSVMAAGQDKTKWQKVAETGKTVARRMGDFQAFVQSMIP